MTGSIRVLPPDTVARIAAGEVITRPRAVVKELIDNAIDAGATRIDVEIETGGYDRIAVHDNGSGIRAVDAAVVFTRHATSKLNDLVGLASVLTLGFRGEALASIAAVAEVEVRTRHRDDTVGSGIKAAYGDGAKIAPLVRQPGTSVDVRGIFSRYPVRRSTAEPASEGRGIRRLMTQFALLRPDTAFTLRVDGRMAIMSSGGTAREVFAEIVGHEALPFLLDLGPLALPDASVSGIVSGPSVHRSNREGIVTAINGRVCEAVEVRKAVERAYADVLPRHRFPHAVLNIQVPPDRMDVNVHPAKERVVLHDGRTIASELERELRTLLGRTTHLVTEKRSLALQLGQLPGLGAREDAPLYAGSAWGTRVVEAGSLPRLRVVGQVEDTLIVCDSDVGTLLIDQHRAHERVIFERMVSREMTELDEPVVLAISHRALALLDARRDDLHGAGWIWQELGLDHLLVSACPVGFEPDDLLPVIERFAAETTHSILAAAACHAAIRKRRPLTPDAALALLSALTATSTPTTCPHGQPIILNLDRVFLERQFGWR